jgi:hypothetical protein
VNKLLVCIPGMGDGHFEDKKFFFKENINKIKNTFSGDIDFLIINYSDNDYSDIKMENLSIIKDVGIIGQFILEYLNPSKISNYDYIIIMLDDILLSDNFDVDFLIYIYNKYNLNIISPSLTKDSKFSYTFMLENENNINELRIVNFCEYFFYLMDLKSFNNYYNIIDDKTYWMWGIDLCLYNNGFRMGIVNDIKIKHFYISESYHKNLPNPIIEMNDKVSKYGKISNMFDIQKIKI